MSMHKGHWLWHGSISIIIERSGRKDNAQRAFYVIIIGGFFVRTILQQVMQSKHDWAGNEYYGEEEEGYWIRDEGKDIVGECVCVCRCRY